MYAPQPTTSLYPQPGASSVPPQYDAMPSYAQTNMYSTPPPTYAMPAETPLYPPVYPGAPPSHTS